MKKKLNNKGVSLMELIVVVAIMAVLIGILVPNLVRYVEKAKQARVEKEASEMVRSAQLAFVEVAAGGNEPKEDVITHVTEKSSAYYRGGTKYGNLTNWTVHNGVVATASNAPFAKVFFELLEIPIGKNEWKNGTSSIPISVNQPKINPAGSLTKECIFQIFYDQSGRMVVEYSREGYFVRMEESVLVESIKITNATDKHFTSWTK